MRRLSEGGVYYTFPFPNAAFIGRRRLEEEMGAVLSFVNYFLGIKIFQLKLRFFESLLPLQQREYQLLLSFTA